MKPKVFRILTFLAVFLGALALGFAVMGRGQEAASGTARQAAADGVVYIPAVANNYSLFEFWSGSPHNDTEAEAFNHWNLEDPPAVPETCAKCHSTPGFLDFLGLDGSTIWQVDSPAPVGTTIECDACHNRVADIISEAHFPSGEVVTGLGREGHCISCHQGRSSGAQVDAHIEDTNPSSWDAVDYDFTFQNIHHDFAGATRFGSQAGGGYQYEGRDYDPFYAHVPGSQTCLDCHDEHSLSIQPFGCQNCHEGAGSLEAYRQIRANGSTADYDGDGNTSEGIRAEIEGLRLLLYQAMRAYAGQFCDDAIAYAPSSFPFFFNDENNNGVVDEGETVVFSSWTARLLAAAYNYHFSVEDPGAYMHNAKYVLQLLYDSIDNLNLSLSAPVDLGEAQRDDFGHFDGTSISWRYWDEAGAVLAACSTCHSTEGYRAALDGEEPVDQPPSSSLECWACHDDLQEHTRFSPQEVEFASSAVLDIGETDSNLCMVCHQSRRWTGTVDGQIDNAGVGDDQVSADLLIGGLNPHYQIAASTLYGSVASSAYEYAGGTYAGRYPHDTGWEVCTDCHDPHSLRPQLDGCLECHPGAAALDEIRTSLPDYDGDGDSTEGIAGEIDTIHELLLQEIYAYAETTSGGPLVYAPGWYPYFYFDLNGDGIPDPDETVSENIYNAFTPRLVRAAYNYLYVANDPGAYTHNPVYVLQALYDSLEDLGGDVSGMTRP